MHGFCVPPIINSSIINQASQSTSRKSTSHGRSIKHHRPNRAARFHIQQDPSRSIYGAGAQQAKFFRPNGRDTVCMQVWTARRERTDNPKTSYKFTTCDSSPSLQRYQVLAGGSIGDVAILGECTPLSTLIIHGRRTRISKSNSGDFSKTFIEIRLGE